MPTILVKHVPEEVLKELKRLKVELNCKTWADLLARLARYEGNVVLSNDDVKRMRLGAKGFLELSRDVSRRWSGPPSVLAESRKSRGHEKRN